MVACLRKPFVDYSFIISVSRRRKSQQDQAVRTAYLGDVANVEEPADS